MAGAHHAAPAAILTNGVHSS